MSLIGVQLARQHMFADAAEVQDRAVTVRPSSTALFSVDSADRYASQLASQFGIASPYNFSITRGQSLLNGFFKRIAVTEIVFPYFIPNVNSQTKVIKVIYNGGAEATLTLTEGFYSPPALAAALQTALIPLTNAGTTVVYNSLGQFVIDVGAGNDLMLFDPSPNSNDPNNFGLFDLIGGLDTWFAAASQTLTGKSTRCRFTEYVDIVSPQLTYNQDLKDGSSDPIVRDALCRVYIEDETSPVIPVYQTAAPAGPVMTSSVAIPGTYPYTIYRKFPHPKQILWNSTQSIGNLTFQVYDSRGTLLSANSTTMPDYKCPDWRMSLLVSEN
jgi:hypothetical protein